jgi:hypothetical protein
MAVDQLARIGRLEDEFDGCRREGFALHPEPKVDFVPRRRLSAARVSAG